MQIFLFGILLFAGVVSLVWLGSSAKKLVLPQTSLVQEAGSMEESSNEEWWVNSGAYIIKTEAGFKTIQDELSPFSRWRVRYFFSNAVDTDSGYHPQNIFRLVRKTMWENGDQTVYARIVKLHMSESPERDAWSGVFLFLRYKDQDNLYYAGLRQDGAAVIKKKIGGIYYTLAYTPFFYLGITPYNRDSTPNLIPGMRWIGLRTVAKTEENGIVSIRLLVQKEEKEGWKTALEAVDDGKTYGGPALEKGYGGIRSDFMDVEFRDYMVKPLETLGNFGD
ncbi:MAG: hypothetical protein HYT49_00710 [Candidatus Wildermuthbacteria bacterium]|nr:hypothetical protein [Candidatus Wildermuthbacteria bacterium]